MSISKAGRILALATLAVLFSIATTSCGVAAQSQSTPGTGITLDGTYLFRSQGFDNTGRPFFESGYVVVRADGTTSGFSTLHALNQTPLDIRGTGTYVCETITDGLICHGKSNDGTDSSDSYLSADRSTFIGVGRNADGATWQAQGWKQ